MPDGRHAIETIFAFCTDGDRLSAKTSDTLSLEISGPFAAQLGDPEDNLVLKAARALAEASGVQAGAAITLEKNLPVSSGLGGGSADAGAALRLLTSLWGIDPSNATAVAPTLGSDVPACLLSMPARGEGAGDKLQSDGSVGLFGNSRSARQSSRCVCLRLTFSLRGTEPTTDPWRIGGQAGTNSRLRRSSSPRRSKPFSHGFRLSRALTLCACPDRARPASPCSEVSRRVTARPSSFRGNGGIYRPSCVRRALQ